MRTLFALFGIGLLALGILIGACGIIGIALSVVDHTSTMMVPAIAMLAVGLPGAGAGAGLFLLLRYKDELRSLAGCIFALFAAFFGGSMLLPGIGGHWLLGLMAILFAVASISFFMEERGAHSRPQIA